MAHKTTEACVWKKRSDCCLINDFGFVLCQFRAIYTFLFVAGIFRRIDFMWEYSFLFVILPCSVQESIYFVFKLLLCHINTTRCHQNVAVCVLCVTCVPVGVCVCEHKNDSMVEYPLLVGAAVSALSKLQPHILGIFGCAGAKQKHENITLNIVIKHYSMHCVGELAESCEKLHYLFMTWLSTANCCDCLKACKGITWSSA